MLHRMIALLIAVIVICILGIHSTAVKADCALILVRGH